MRHYFFSYLSTTNFSLPVCNHQFLLRCLPQTVPFAHVEQQQLLIPQLFWTRRAVDTFGNSIVYGGMRDWHRGFAYQSSGLVQMDEYTIADPTPCRIYGTAHAANPLLRAEQLCHYVYDNMEYCPGATSVFTSPQEAWAMHRGVCQDFAHIMVGMCRDEGIAARYVCGLICGEGQTHAWVEVWADGAWHAFDPTHDRRIDYGYLKIAHGRSAADCSVNRGMYCGQAIESTTVQTILQEICR